MNGRYRYLLARLRDLMIAGGIVTAAFVLCALVAALRGETDMDTAVALIKQSSRRYAKRQWTWFRHDPRVQWFDFTEYPSAQALEEALLKRIREDMTQNN